MDESLTAQVAASIRRYLAVHPNAADTARGIHDWWVDWPGPPAPLGVTLAALDALEAEGIVARVGSGDGALWRRR